VPPARTSVTYDEGELVEMGAGPVKKDKRTDTAKEWDLPRKRRFWAELLGHAEAHGYKPGWAFHKYKERMGVGPSGATPAPIWPPSNDTASWVISRNIAWRSANARRSA
jgi:hypothetical protein